MKTKVTYIISDIDRAVGFEEIYKNLQNKFSFSFILLNKRDSYFENYCRNNKIDCYRVKYSGKINLISALLKVFFLLKKIKPNIVHTHLFDASLIGLTAAKFANITKRIHTRHHSDYHHTYFPHAVKYDNYINKISYKIIAVSSSVATILIERENVVKEKIITIYHGFKVNEFNEVSQVRINSAKEKYNPKNKYPVIGVISRYTEWKGVQYVISAFKELLKKYPNALLILANAQGSYQKQINSLLSEIPKESYQQIVFETDLFALYKLFTIFVHVPITSEAEAFGQVYIEALLSKVPCVFTKSGIANEFPENIPMCIFIEPQNPSQILEGIIKILTNKDISNQLTTKGYEYSSENFSIEHQMTEIEKLYNML